MARMSDEAYEYKQDCKEKQFTARSVHNRKGHTGKSGMKTAMDYMSKKQLQAMNGEVKTYRLGSPMGWEEFVTMPDDLKKMYVKKLRDKFDVPDEELAVAMGTDIWKFVACLKTIRLTPKHLGTDGRNWYGTDEAGRFQTWWRCAEES